MDTWQPKLKAKTKNDLTIAPNAFAPCYSFHSQPKKCGIKNISSWKQGILRKRLLVDVPFLTVTAVSPIEV